MKHLPLTAFVLLGLAASSCETVFNDASIVKEETAILKRELPLRENPPETNPSVSLKEWRVDEGNIIIKFAVETSLDTNEVIFSFIDEDGFLLSSRTVKHIFPVGMVAEVVGNRAIQRGSIRIPVDDWLNCDRVGTATRYPTT